MLGFCSHVVLYSYLSGREGAIYAGEPDDDKDDSVGFAEYGGGDVFIDGEDGTGEKYVLQLLISVDKTSQAYVFPRPSWAPSLSSLDLLSSLRPEGDG